MPHRDGEVKVVLGEQSSEIIENGKQGNMKIAIMGTEEPVNPKIQTSGAGLKNGHSIIPLAENSNGFIHQENGHDHGDNGVQSPVTFPCDDPAIIAKPSDFQIYTNGLSDNNFDDSEVNRPKKIYRVVLTGGK